jgi:hypothetical protein
VDAAMLVEELKRLGANRKLIRMAERGQLLELACEMPTCYREHEQPGGRQLFDEWPQPNGPKNKWSPNPDHYPKLAMDGGKLDPWNVRLAHVWCNNIDWHLRKRIRELLQAEPSLSFDQLAERLNRKQGALKLPHEEPWTAESLRKTYAS